MEGREGGERKKLRKVNWEKDEADKIGRKGCVGRGKEEGGGGLGGEGDKGIRTHLAQLTFLWLGEIESYSPPFLSPSSPFSPFSPPSLSSPLTPLLSFFTPLFVTPL